MTKEQEEAISRLRKITNRQILYGNKFGITIEGFRELQEDIETVLNMLKENSAEIHQKNTELAEKNAEIEKYKKLLADNLARELNNSIKAKEKADTDLDDLNKGWQVELEKYKQLYNKALDDAVITAHDNMKKDKMIDLMAEEMKKRATCPLDDYNYDLDCENKCNNNTKECWKQYFERKAEQSSSINKTQEKN